MTLKNARENRGQTQRSVPFDIWRTGGVTEHLGGVYSTQRLLEFCHATRGQTVLDIGCGTGYTACQLAKQYGSCVVALDISFRCVEEARKRVVKEGVSGQVAVLHADAHRLPFPDNAFDLAIAESVLVFCDAAHVASEIHRVLKPGGMFGDNELTLLKPPPEELLTLLVNMLGIQTFQEEGWRSIFAGAGFADVFSVVQRMRLWEQVASHVKVDGVAAYLSAMVKGLANLKISRVFINRGMFKAARQFMPMVGYGLFTGRKRA